jgi:protein O-mannosyl-transferase
MAVNEWFAPCALCAITLLVYGNSFAAGFAVDNRTLILEDSRVHRATAENLGLIFHHTYWWPGGEAGLYRPVTTLSYLLNYAILGNGDHPAGYHWINLLLHAGNVLLIFVLARRLTGEAPAFLIAAVWAVHPVLTESVTNIVGRADLLAGMTTLGGLWMYLRSFETSGRRRLAWLAGLAAVTAIGVFCKESAVAILGIVALYEVTWWNPRRLRGFVLGCLAMSPALLAMWWARSRVMAGPVVFPFVDNPIVAAGFRAGRLTALKVLAKYLGLLAWPAHLSVDYSYAQIPLADGRPTDWIAWLVVAGAAVATAFLFRRNKAAFFAAGFAFLTLLPASNLVIPVGTIMAERLLYLPAAGFAVCLILALYSISRKVRLGTVAPFAAGLLIMAGFAARTWARNADWRDDFTIWSAAVQTSPLSFKTHYGLAQAMLEGRSDPEGEMVDSALAEDEKSLAILDPLADQRNAARVYYTTGSLYVARGYRLAGSPAESVAKLERGKALLLRGLAIGKADRSQNRDTEATAYLILSEADQQLGNIDEALQSARKAQALGPMRSDVYGRIQSVLLAAGRKDEARAILMEGYLLTSDPGLQRKLVADYADRPDEGKCAISYAQATPAIDFSCASVRKLACSVSAKYGCTK